MEWSGMEWSGVEWNGEPILPPLSPRSKCYSITMKYFIAKVFDYDYSTLGIKAKLLILKSNNLCVFVVICEDSWWLRAKPGPFHIALYMYAH